MDEERRLVLAAIKRIDWKSLRADTRLSASPRLILLNLNWWNYENNGIPHDACRMVSSPRCTGITPSFRGTELVYCRRRRRGNYGIGFVYTRPSGSQKGA